jgi:hypothetical protein
MRQVVANAQIVLQALLLGLALTTAAGAAWAADGQPDHWEVNVAPYLWAAGLYGDVTVRGVTASPDASFIDILESSDSLFGLQGHVEVRRGPFGGFADVFYMKLGVDDAGRTQADIENRMWLVEFGLQYRVLETTGAEGRGGIALDVYAGGRYSDMEIDIDTRGAPSVNQSADWLDPIVGGQVNFGVTERFFILIRGDVGGFGVGSDFAWSALGLLGYRWQGAGLEWAVLAGYKALGQDYTSDAGARRFQWDTTMHGPIVGLNVRF